MNELQLDGKLIGLIKRTTHGVIMSLSINDLIKTVFLYDIISNLKTIEILSPNQACYVGTQYAKFLKKMIDIDKAINLPSPITHTFPNYKLLYQTRENFVCFQCNLTGNQFLMDPLDIVQSDNLIQKFTATGAFHIGLLAGSKSQHHSC